MAEQTKEKIRWITQESQIETALLSELKKSILTNDGRGAEFKEKCLNEIIKRLEHASKNKKMKPSDSTVKGDLDTRVECKICGAVNNYRFLQECLGCESKIDNQKSIIGKTVKSKTSETIFVVNSVDQDAVYSWFDDNGAGFWIEHGNYDII